MISTDNLKAEMKRKHISRQDIADLLGMTYRSICNRFKKTDWRLTECIKIKESFFPEFSLDYLFTKGTG